MISCLVNYIGLKDVTPDPLSGRYVNELPGIDTNQFDLIKDNENYDILDAWEDIERRTIRKFENIINQWAKKYYQNYSYISNTISGQVTDDTTIAVSDNYAGWYFVDTWNYYKNLNFEIPWIEIYSQEDVSGASFFVFNASTGDKLDEFTSDLIGGQINQVTINKVYPLWKYPKLFICYDESQVISIRQRDLYFDNTPNFSQRRVSNSARIIGQNLVGTGNIGQGMIINYNVDCGIDNYVCGRRGLFEECYMYLLGVEFCNERINSIRINQYTLLDRDRAISLRDEFQSTFNDMLEGTLTGLKIDYGNDDFCFTCDRAVTYKALIP